MTEYGPEIPVNGKRPEFVRDDDMVMDVDVEKYTHGDIRKSYCWHWPLMKAIRLPATHPYYATQINYDLPVQTRDGRAVRILCTDAPGDYPVLGICDEDVMTWKLDGVFYSKGGSGNNLMNAPAKPVRVSRWANVNIYHGYDTRTTCDNLELIFEDGKLVEAVVHD